MMSRIDDNVGYVEEDGKRVVACNHCSHVIADDSNDYFTRLAHYEGTVSMAGPQVNPDSAVYVDAQVIFHQYCCPNCFTAFHTEVVPTSRETFENQDHVWADGG